MLTRHHGSNSIRDKPPSPDQETGQASRARRPQGDWLAATRSYEAAFAQQQCQQQLSQPPLFVF